MYFSFSSNPYPTLCLTFCTVKYPFNISQRFKKLERIYVFRLKDKYYIQGSTVSMKTSGFIPIQHKSDQQMGEC